MKSSLDEIRDIRRARWYKAYRPNCGQFVANFVRLAPTLTLGIGQVSDPQG